MGDGAVCVLCQQPHGDTANDRFQRFYRHMTDTTQRDATAAERGYESALVSLSALDFATQQK